MNDSMIFSARYFLFFHPAQRPHSSLNVGKLCQQCDPRVYMYDAAFIWGAMSDIVDLVDFFLFFFKGGLTMI